MKITGFAPIAGPDARVLVLGTMPSPASLQAGFYYAHPRNAFWPIMGSFCGFPADAPFALRAQALRRTKIALWDVCRACVRPGSGDAAIRDVEPNDFASFFAKHPNIQTILFNGTTAERLFFRFVLQQDPSLGTGRKLLRLPSTSPANARLSLQQKAERWHAALREALRSP